MTADATTQEVEPELPSGSLQITAPPPLPDPVPGGSMLMNLFPVLGALGSIAVLLTMGGGDRARTLMAGGMFAFATVGFLVVQVDRTRRQRVLHEDEARTDYLHYLAEVRSTVRAAAEQQRAGLLWHFPTPETLVLVAEAGVRVAERGPEHPRFGQCRFGLTRWPLLLDLQPPPESPVNRSDPVAASALYRLLAVHRHQEDLPAILDLAAFDRVEMCGPRPVTRDSARALLCSAVTAHAPADLVVAVVTGPESRSAWDWLKWLPHAASPTRRDAAGGLRTVTSTIGGLQGLLRGLAARTRVLVVLDGVGEPLRAGVPGAVGAVHPGPLTVLDLREEWPALTEPTWLRVLCEPAAASARDDPTHAPTKARTKTPTEGQRDATTVSLVHPPIRTVLDRCPVPVAEAIARRLAAWHARANEGRATTPGGTDLPGLLARVPHEHLRVPIGVDDQQRPVLLDLTESARGGMGPHGLVVGATGSGKSEFLRTLLTALVRTHAPDVLNLVLVDFKGGATFAGLAHLPHVSAVITNLASDLTLVDRMQDALGGELVRRQELLKAAGNCASVGEYDQARARHPERDLPPLPALLVVVDEFSELLSAQPDFIDLFVAIGRLGRSLGLHLLLSSQRLEEGRLRGLDSHLSYRVGLRTFSATESRAVLGVPDAHHLPNRPGVGYLRTDPTTLVPFTAAYVSGPGPLTAHAMHGPDDEPDGQPDEQPDGQTAEQVVPARIRPFTLDPMPGTLTGGSDADPEAVPPVQPLTGPSLLERTVADLLGSGPRAHPVWLPPLTHSEALGEVWGDVQEHRDLGLCSPSGRALGGANGAGLVLLLGTVDRPREQRRDPLTVDLSGSAGHVAVVGGPRSGKSTLVRTLVASLALTNTPAEAQVYVLDFGGGTFAGWEAVPHVSGVATRREPDVVRRVVAEVGDLVERRERSFAEQGIDSIASVRAMRRADRSGPSPSGDEDPHGEVFLVIDGWSTLRAEFEDLEADLQALAGRGLAFGVHLVTSAARWTDYRTAVRDLLGTRLELKLGDPLDSEVDRRSAARVPAGQPGRGLLSDGAHFLAALPTLRSTGPETVASTEGAEGFDGSADALVEALARGWHGPPGPTLRLLPRLVTRVEVLESAAPEGTLLVGIDERRLAPVTLDPGQDPHLLVYGEGRSGRTTVLRTYLAELVRTRSAEQAQVVLVDHRRTLLGQVPPTHLAEHCTSGAQTPTVLAGLAETLTRRLPGPGVTASQLRHRSWWQGPEVFVVIDDYDLVASGATSPATPLLPLLPVAGDVGLHVVVARRTGGAGRALYEPLLQTLRELASPGLLLPGSPEEGPLVGSTKARPGPPGRAQLVTRTTGVTTVQTVWTPEAVLPD